MIRVKKGDVQHAVLAVVIPQVELFGNTVGKGLLGMSARNLCEARKYVGNTHDTVGLALLDETGVLPPDQLRLPFMKVAPILLILLPKQHALRVRVTKDLACEVVIEALEVIGVHMGQKEQSGLRRGDGHFGDKWSGKKVNVFGSRSCEAVHPNEGELEQVAASRSATDVVWLDLR